MHTTIADTRTTNRLDPDSLMEQIAQAEILIAKANARFEARVKTLKDKYEQEVADQRAALTAAQRRLADWITTNRDQFQRPRSRSNAYGRYGLRAVTSLRITDADELLHELASRGCEDAIKRVVEPIKSAVTKRIKEGQLFHSAHLEEGERTFVDVHKAIIEQALQEVI